MKVFLIQCGKMVLMKLLILYISSIYAYEPIFNCSSPCKTHTANTQQYFFTRYQNGIAIIENSGETTEFEVGFALNYYNSSLSVDVDGRTVQEKRKSNFDPYFQYVSYTYSGTFTNNITITSNIENARFYITTGKDNKLTVMELIKIPLTRFHIHGSFWNQRLYGWIFLIVTVVISLLYLSWLRATTMGFTLIILAVSVFVATCADKIYHIIVATQTIKIESLQLAYSICVVAFCFELLPIVACYIYVTLWKAKPRFVLVILILFATGFMFLGSGYYVGIGLLYISAILLLLRLVFM